MEYLPVDQDNTKDLERVKESIGVVGLKFLMYGIDRDRAIIRKAQGSIPPGY